MTDRGKGVLCALMAVSMFSTFTIVSRLGLTTTALTMWDMAMLRFGIAGGLLLPVLVRHGIPQASLWQLALLAVTGGLGFVMSAYVGFGLAPASHGGVLLHGTIPLFTLLLAVLAARRRATALALSGASLILAGAVAMLWDSMRTATPRQWLGDGALLMAALCWAVFGLMAQRLAIRPLQATALVAVSALFCFAPIYLVLPDTNMANAGWNDIVLQAAVQGVLIGVVSVLAYTKAVAFLGARDTAMFTALVPIMTTLAGAWLLGETVTTIACLGVAGTTAGMLVAMRATAESAKSQRSRSPAPSLTASTLPDR